ncbi:Esterase/lipase superfamily enzyme [Chitinophaga sp. YR573]|uniref:pentapeptide repeat-containing protein n=1 Tax=Chitinophaga sp. YR573 TaxID=1881040 RepID=UPI0008B93A9A|nr:alpha/beta hydrolase [Chitinophaga sp. YR573]SEW34322.1 Esterase/lipase superfamily enzyme [Chitinophaga sp. YR573]
MANPTHVKLVHEGAESLLRWRERNKDIRLDLTGANLSGINLENASLENTRLDGANLSKTNLMFARLKHVRMMRTDLSESNLEGADLSDGYLYGCKFRNSFLRNANLQSCSMYSCDLEDADLDESNLTGIVFSGCNLLGIDFKNKNLAAGHFSNSYLASPDFSFSNLSMTYFSEIDLSNAIFKKTYLLKASFQNVNLTKADFSGADLRYVTIKRSVLPDSIFIDAHLSDADLRYSNLYRANFTNAHLAHADLRGCNFQEALLIGANLEEAKLETTNLTSTDLSYANIKGTNFWHAILEDIKSTGIDLSVAVTEQSTLPSSFDNTVMYRVQEPDKLNYAVVEVFYGTNREPLNSSVSSSEFGIMRGQLSFGKCEVSIPRDHRLGKLEAPSIFRLEFRQDPQKHIVLLKTLLEKEEQFVRSLTTKWRNAKKQEAIVFIHGYNVSFEDAARRSAQIHYDLAFEGISLFFSWPSEVATVNYTVDEANIEYAEPDLATFLNLVVQVCGINTVHILAHSMGNRALLRVLASIAENSIVTDRQHLTFNQIMLAAPDVDQGHFTNLLKKILHFAHRFTLYASENDKALLLSKKIHRYPRAGDAGDNIVIIEQMDSIDVSQLDTDFLGHSYYGDHKSLICDIFNLLRHKSPPEERFGLIKVQSSKGCYWQFRIGM